MTTTTAEKQGRRRTLMTPEQLPLSLTIAPVGDRVAAFGLDVAILVGGSLVLALLCFLPISFTGLDETLPFLTVFLLVHFILWNGYFLFFELMWQGRTPGKRWQRLRVISRDGGPLTTGAVFGRNLMRDLEFYLPAQALFMPELIYGDGPGWALVLATSWLLLFLLMPLFNRDRARVGDLVAGTLVVKRPEARLLDELTEAGAASKDQSTPDYVFTQEQLDMYGIHELQVLEDLLRRWQGQTGRRRSVMMVEQADLMALVCDKIQRKIGWKDKVPPGRTLDFLQDFYRAQRHRLEHRLLMGERRERKREGRIQ